MKRTSRRTRSSSKWALRSANFFGALGYLIVVFQWVITIALFTPLLSFLPKAGQPMPVDSPLPAAPVDDAISVVGFVFVLAITAVMVALAFVVLVKLPFAIAKTSKKAVGASSKALTTTVLKVTHKKDTKKRRLVIQPRIVGLIKLALLVVPLCFAYVSRFLPEAMLEPDMALFVVVMFANLALGAFLIQYAIAYFSRINKKDIW